MPERETNRTPSVRRWWGFVVLALAVLVLSIGREDPVRAAQLGGAALVVAACMRAATWEWTWRRHVTAMAVDAAAVGLFAESMLSGSRPPTALLGAADVATSALSERIRRAVGVEASTAEVAQELAGGALEGHVAVVCRRLAEDLTLSERVGGSLAEMAQTLADDLRDEVRLARAMDSAVAGMRTTALMLCVLPVLGLLMSRGFVPSMGISGGLPGSCIAAGMCAYAAGLLWLAWLIRRARRGP